MKKIKSYNPADGEFLGEVEVLAEEERKKLVKKAKEAQSIWEAMGIDKRIQLLQGAAKDLGEMYQTLGFLIHREMGKPLDEAYGEVHSTAGYVSYIAPHVKKAVAAIEYKNKAVTTRIQYGPKGVCGIITPWNYPIMMAQWMVIPALLVGNTVIVKPSEETPLSTKLYVDTIKKRLPPGVLEVMQGDEKEGEWLVKTKEVDMIGFTGSRETGMRIMSVAAAELKPLVMELGGKDAVYVMKDGNLQTAAAFALSNGLSNCGQMCVSTEFVYVHQDAYTDFINHLIKRISCYKTGSNIGPIVNSRHKERITSLIQDALEKGAELIYGNNFDNSGNYISPTILGNITPGMDIFREEIFGPVICVNRYQDIEDSVKEVESTEFGLSAVIFGKEGARELAEKLNVGMIGINMGVGGLGDSPWVGSKKSGFGYHGSADGHRQFAQVKVINFQNNENDLQCY
jgi:acyl-CoA reductase-like NAD-dependent aldehyde dehydrogenase